MQCKCMLIYCIHAMQMHVDILYICKENVSIDILYACKENASDTCNANARVDLLYTCKENATVDYCIHAKLQSFLR